MLDGVKKFTKLKDGSIYFIVRLSGRNKNVPASKALVELPTQLLPRFLVLPETGKLKYIIFLDDVIRYCLNIVFSIFGYDQYQAYAIKLTRDSELDMGSDLSESFLVKVSKSLKRRKEGRPVRFIFDKDMDNELLRSEEHTSELQSLMRISYAVFCLKKKKNNKHITSQTNYK